MVVGTNRPSHANSLTRLFVVITLSTLYLATLARVITPEQPKSGVKAQNESVLHEPSYVGSRIVSPTAPALWGLSAHDDSHGKSNEKRAVEDQVSWDDALRAGKRILSEFDERRIYGSPGYTGLEGGSEEAQNVLDNEFEEVHKKWDQDMSKDHLTKSLVKDGITTKMGEWLKFRIRGKKATNTYFENFYVYDSEARAGVIVASDVSRQRKAKIHWSEVAFQQYKKEFPKSALPDLKYIYRSYIVNMSTVDFITRIIGKMGQSQDTVQMGNQKWYVIRRETNPDFFAVLLGSENGRGAGNLVNDHMEDLGDNRGVTEIHILDETPPSMKMVLGPIC